jgi:hypothetical protein
VNAALVGALAVALLAMLIRARAAGGGRRIGLDAAIVFTALLAVYLANGRTIWAGDTLPARYLPLSILREGDFDLDEFPFLYDRSRFAIPWFVRRVDGHYVSDYPVGAPVLAVPFYVPAVLAGIRGDSPAVEQVEKLAAAALVALSAALLYLTLRRLTDRAASLAIALVYGLGTSALSASSQALWQHGAGQLGLAAGLWCLVAGRSDGRWIALAGFPLAFAVISRPSNAVVAAALAVYVLVHHRPRVWGFALAALPPAAFQVWYNLAYFGQPVRLQFFSSVAEVASLQRPEWATPLWEGVAGILLSPGRGLFVYSPILLLSFAGAGLALRRGGDRLLRYVGVGVVLGILLYGKWWSWWGGASYGPRLLADLAPLLAVLLYPIAPLARARRDVLALAVALAAWSILAHGIGAFVDDLSWNADVTVDEAPQHLWSPADNQLVQPLRAAATAGLVAALGLPTSRTSPALLSASYRADGAPLAVPACGPVRLAVTAINTGRAVWLPGGTGAVRLVWRWGAGGAMDDVRGAARLRYAVWPGGSHTFRLAIPRPGPPGSYRLDLGLVSERVTWFSDQGSAPLALDVAVPAGC